MKWITREKAKVDRIACPWLISRFIDRNAEFIFTDPGSVLKEAERQNAIPFDVPGAELTHYRENDKEYVSFDAIIKKYSLKDSALSELARIVRSADSKQHEPAEEAYGLKAAALGFSMIAENDHENMKLQFPMYDALYAYCRWTLSEKKDRA